jgi:hypothetical protein
MSKVNDFETDILELIFENADLAGIGDGTGLQGSTVAGSFYIALFTADPGEAGSVANEATYTGYARKAISRAGGSWTTANGATENTAAITFDACTGGSNTITHFGICKAGTASVADLIYYGALDSSLAVSSGITPEFAAGALDLSEG